MERVWLSQRPTARVPLSPVRGILPIQRHASSPRCRTGVTIRVHILQAYLPSSITVAVIPPRIPRNLHYNRFLELPTRVGTTRADAQQTSGVEPEAWGFKTDGRARGSNPNLQKLGELGHPLLRGVCNGQKIACGWLDIEAQQQKKVLPVREIMWLNIQDMWTC